MVDAVAGEPGAGETPPPQLVPLDIPSNAAPGPDEKPAPGPFTREAFFAVFVSAFAMAGAGFAVMARVPLPTLERVGTMPQARPASDALYDTLTDLGVIHWFSEDGLFFKWAGRMGIMAAFAMAVREGVRADLAAHAARNVTPKAAGA